MQSERSINSKSYSLTVITLLLTNLCAGAWFASKLSSDVEALTKQGYAKRVVVLETQMVDIQKHAPLMKTVENRLIKISNKQAEHGSTLRTLEKLVYKE